MEQQPREARRIGLLGATGLGVGAIVGGGILALAGVAFATTGPSAMLAFALNGVIGLLTALSFAELASKFPESGGAYTFAKKVLRVEGAFMVGWVVWFASLVAAALYALGFVHFAFAAVVEMGRASGANLQWLASPGYTTAGAIVATALLSVTLIYSGAGGGDWANLGKIVVFGLLIAGGVWTTATQPSHHTVDALQPFFTAGASGLLQAMGYSFIALQGFDLIAAVGGEIRDPARNIPRAMVLSLCIALAIYLPLLFVITAAGTPEGIDIGEAAAQDPEGVVANAARHFLGPWGYWLVITAAVLSMFSALQANLFAASRILAAMARDRTMPARLGAVSGPHDTPVGAVVVTGAIVSILLAALPDVATAGAASSLIFLVTFALAHWVAILVRQRSRRPAPFRVPWFPAVPLTGGLACIGLALFQGISVPSAGLISVVWLAVGGAMFMALFAHRARIRDAASTAFDPELSTLRGHAPLVLVPLANPKNTHAMVDLADALAPADAGRILLLTVVVAPDDWQQEENPAPLERVQEVQRELFKAAAAEGVRAEVLTTVASEPMEEIVRVAAVHRCESVLLGLSNLADDDQIAALESLLGTADFEVVIIRAPHGWQLDKVKRILAPIAGAKSGHDHLLARILGSLLRTGQREITWLRVAAPDVSPDDEADMRRELGDAARDMVRQRVDIDVVRSSDPAEAVIKKAEEFDLLIVGVQQHGHRRKLLGEFTRRVARHSTCPLIVISHRD